ncbi:MAG: hypothetical protein A2167_03315 [Planctomycetes bacterium RBG_13_46_10]|nr:MAG: hypothetical protein A2167_03315 [Planctomycetes bacterium RBG_13_46_10]
MKDKSPTYWNEYSNLQYTKHKLISEYLKGWFPKLGSWCGKILYIDTHAGRGKHIGGQEGSPLVALKTFLEHTYKDKILSKCEVKFIFIEWDESNVDQLQGEVKAIGKLPQHVTCDIYSEDAFKLLSDLVKNFEIKNYRLAPCFMFVDPYGFNIPCDLLRRIKSNSRSELLITVIWRELDMAIMNKNRPPELTETLNSVFNGNKWEVIQNIQDYEERGETTVQMLKTEIGAKWATYIRMLGDNNKTRYFLLHLTDHEAGRDLMKDVIWKCCPNGGYFARKRDDPKQQYLIKPIPDLKELKEWLFCKLSIKPHTWEQLKDMLREEIWLNKHLWSVIKELEKNKQIEPSNFTGRFSQKSNPTLKLVKT